MPTLILILAIGTASGCAGTRAAPTVACFDPPRIEAAQLAELKKWRAGVCADPAQAVGCRYLKWAYRAESVARALKGGEK